MKSFFQQQQQQDDEESFTEVRGKHSTDFSKKRKRSCGIENPFLEDDISVSNIQHFPSSSLARPVGSTNAKSVTEKASIE